jgi:hypothetical protein
MRGLPDSAVVGIYKRAHRKPKRKPMAYYKREADFLNGLVYKMITAGQKKKGK